MLRLSRRRSSFLMSVACILGATSRYVSFCDASMWSDLTEKIYSITEYATTVDGEQPAFDPEMDTESTELVSPIVNREIKVSVEAPWPSSSQHSVLCEAFLFLKGDHTFLDALTVNHGRDHLITFERSTQYALELAAGIGFGEDFDEDHAMDSHIRLLKVALTMRAMAPACELHRSIAYGRYPDYVDYLETFGVITYSTNTNDATTTEFIVETSAEIPNSPMHMPKMTKAQRNALLLPNEVVREGSTTFIVNKDEDDETEMTSAVVILYAQLGGFSFATFYRKLVENEIPFVVRHMGSVDDDQEVSVLQGYGVRLDIRNVEYKVFDDKKMNHAEDAMINLTSLGANSDSDESGDEGPGEAGMSTCGPKDSQSNNHLTTHFLAGVNLTALDLSVDDGECQSESSSAEELQRQLWKLHNRFEQHSQLIPPTWQRRHLSIQAATTVAGSRDPLIALQDISQNLPSMASTLVHVPVPKDIKDIAESLELSLQRLTRTSGGGFWINGKSMMIERPSFNVFELIQLLQDEGKVLADIERRIKPTLSSNVMRALEQIQDAYIEGDSFFSENSAVEEDEEDEMNDDAAPENLYRIDLATGDKGSVIYMNDLENDRSYAHWSPSVQNMLMAMQYGMPPSVRRNLFTILVVVDPLDESIDSTVGYSLIGQLIQQQFPLRVALVVASQEEVDTCTQLNASGKVCPVSTDNWLNKDDPPTVEDLREIKATTRDIHRLYAYMRQKFSHKSQALVMYQLYLPAYLRQSPPSNGHFYSLFDIFNVHNEILPALQIVNTVDRLEDIAEFLRNNEEDSNYSYEEAIDFAAKKGIKPGMSFINGRPLPMNEDAAEKIQQIFGEEQTMVLKMIINEEITDTKPRNFYYKLIKGKKKNVYPRLHPLLAGGSRVKSFMDIQHTFGTESLLTPKSMQGDASALDSDAIFIYEAFLALDTPEGLKLALDFLNIMDKIPLRVDDDTLAVKYRIVPTSKGASSGICEIMSSAGTVGFEKVKEILEALFEGSDVKLDEYKSLSDPSSCPDPLYHGESFPSKNFITANGRLYEIGEISLSNFDIELLMTMGLPSSKKVSEMLKPHVNEFLAYDAIGRSTAFLLGKKDGKGKRSGPKGLVASIERKGDIDHNPFRFSWNDEGIETEGLCIKVIAIVDPTTETAQRLSPLLLIIRDELKLPLDLILSPRTELDGDSDIPISSYYRFVADPSAYQVDSSYANPPIARFANLPTDHILTLRMDVPEPWDVQQTRAIQDTDNLRCDLKSGCGDDPQAAIEMHRQTHLTNVVYGLQHLLVFGHCYETNMSPPDGLQLVLSEQKTSSTIDAESNFANGNIEADGSVQVEDKNIASIDASHHSDTLVMKTVGYWQLRANPGIWDLKINNDSRGADIFQMVEGQIKPGGVRVTNLMPNNKKQLVVGDFVGRGHGGTLLVNRKPGYEKATLFYEDEKKISRRDDDVVHVFSLATGHLYERFLKIMMLSVTKRTSTKVKFWLFENFLSPTFKASSIAMAKRVGCEVEFVTYKWPEWLRGQSEKQRIIWGYKILFLDVLFPLSVKKIIYVDADQVIRGDLKELRDMDLNGAPYGYTPMCSSNEATSGFQFWNDGFWRGHLRGKPYHISALYVVDLEKFRKDRVGDVLRSVYQSLSADPNSLANLDQDLPNYAQHQVPIFSLPQEWLWCESWCSNETKAQSKTIDLCNNPLHKEPKVSMAKRIISGDLFEESWIELDAEVEKYENEYILESSTS